MLAADVVSRPDPLQRLLGYAIPPAEQHLSARDCMLYALSVGFGADPMHAGHLQYVSELGSAVVPSLVLTAAAPGFWFKDETLGLDWARLVNVEQSVVIDRPLGPPPLNLRSASRVVSLQDKGEGRGAIVAWERDLFVAGTSEKLATVSSVVLLRGDGHAPDVLKAQPHVRCVSDRLPQRSPDIVIETPTLPISGLLYRLSGPLNPLHADPATARAAGFDRPIMPGTATLGWACGVLVEHCCGFDAAQLRAFGTKLTAPVYPGEMLRHEIWMQGRAAAFRVSIPERDVIALDLGRAEFAAVA